MNITNEDCLRGLESAITTVQSHLGLIAKDPESIHVLGNIGVFLNTKPPTELSPAAAHVYSMSLEHARLAEMQGPGSAMAALGFAKRMMLSSGGREREVHNGNIFTSQDIPQLLLGVLDASDYELACNLIAYGGATRYLVDRAPSRFDSVEHIDSYEFTHVSKSVVGPPIVMDESRILIADGFIESVAEIHGILDYCARNNEKLIICARGFSDDVLHTIAVNRSRGSLMAYALAFPYDEKDANTLVDLAIVAGGDVLSSLKGELFSSVDSSKLLRIPRAKLRGNVLDIHNQLTVKMVNSHVTNLRIKASEADEFNRAVYDKRARRLAGSTIVIRLTSGVRHASRCEMLDLAFRTLQAASAGIVKVEDRVMWPGRAIVPILSVTTAYTMAKKLVSRFENDAFLVD